MLGVNKIDTYSALTSCHLCWSYQGEVNKKLEQNKKKKREIKKGQLTSLLSLRTSLLLQKRKKKKENKDEMLLHQTMQVFQRTNDTL